MASRPRTLVPALTTSAASATPACESPLKPTVLPAGSPTLATAADLPSDCVSTYYSGTTSRSSPLARQIPTLAGELVETDGPLVYSPRHRSPFRRWVWARTSPISVRTVLAECPLAYVPRGAGTPPRSWPRCSVSCVSRAVSSTRASARTTGHPAGHRDVLRPGGSHQLLRQIAGKVRGTPPGCSEDDSAASSESGTRSLCVLTRDLLQPATRSRGSHAEITHDAPARPAATRGVSAAAPGKGDEPRPADCPRRPPSAPQLPVRPVEVVTKGCAASSPWPVSPW